MSFFEGQDAGWSQHRRQQSWDPSTPGARPTASPSQQPEHESAFSSQFEEVSRAAENLTKGGKAYAAGPPGQWPSGPAAGGMHGRRESMPMMGAFSRQLGELANDPRAAGPGRHMSVSEERGGPPGGNIQGYLAHQRFPSRPSEAEQVLQAKRRAAAQRERDLRNYHQEQQFNRKGGSGPKSDRSMSPGTGMSEEDRRELIARQHRALYGENSQLYMGGDASRPLSQDARVLAGTPTGHSTSSLDFDAYAASSGEAGAPGLPATAGASPRDGTQSPQSAATNKQFAMFDSAKPGSTPTTSSPPIDASGHATKGSQSGAVAPIGTRPAGGVPGKRNTPPAPSPLGFGAAGERSQSAASNPSNGPQQPQNGDKGVGLGWNGGSAAWGSSRQASVWG